MKIAIISDPHGNAASFRALLSQFDQEGVDQIICCGDFVGYYPQVDELLTNLRRDHPAIIFVVGNHDHALLRHQYDRVPLIARQSLIHTRRGIASANLEFLASGETQKRLVIDGFTFLIVHGSPANPLDEYVYPNSPALDSLMSAKTDFVLMGHTHIPLITPIGDTLAVNPGSCGLPRDGDPRASYIVIDTLHREITLERLVYDLDSVYMDTLAANLDPTLAFRLYFGCSPGDRVLSAQAKYELFSQLAMEIETKLGYRTWAFSHGMIVEASTLCCASICALEKPEPALHLQTSPYCFEWSMTESDKADIIKTARAIPANDSTMEEIGFVKKGHGYVLQHQWSAPIGSLKSLLDGIEVVFSCWDMLHEYCTARGGWKCNNLPKYQF